MLKRIANLILRSPAPADGGTVVADPNDSDPQAMKGWMTDLPPIDVTGPIQPLEDRTKKKEPDGKTDDKPPGTAGAGLPGDAKPGDKSDTKPADAAAGGKVADDRAKSGKPDDAKPGDAKAPEKGVDGKKEEGKEKVPEPGAEKWPRTSADWDKFKAARKEEREKLQTEISARDGRIKALETELGTVKETAIKNGEPAPEVKAQIERLTKENEEYSRRLQVVEVTQHPQFQAYFENKVNAQRTLAKEILGDKAADFEKVIALPNGQFKNDQLDAFVQDLPILQQSRIGAVLNSLEAIKQERDEEIKKAGEHKATLSAKQVEAQKQNAAATEKLINDTVSSLQSEKEGMAVFQKRDDDVAWNQSVDERITAAKNILSGKGLKRGDIVKAAFHAAAMPAILEAYKSDVMEYRQTIDKLESQVKALSAAQPGAGASAAPAPGVETAPKADIKFGQTPQEAASAFTKALWAEGA